MNDQNIISFYCEDAMHVIFTSLSFEARNNLAIDIIKQVDDETKKGGYKGHRYDIVFYDFSCHKIMSIPNMWPLSEYPITMMSLEDEKIIKNIYNNH